MMQFKTPIPIIVKDDKQDGYALYVESSGMFENDIWTCLLCDGGIIRHYRTDQIVIHYNSTFEIRKK